MEARKIVVVLFLTLVLIASSFARSGRGAHDQQHNRGANLLTDEQKQELHTLISGMREDGATRDDIKEAVDALFAEWGIETPNWGEGRGGRQGFGDPQLTDDQRDILKSTIADLREAEATREEIRAAVEALYAEWGLEMPVRDGRLSDFLTEEQQAELEALVQGMKDAGATREEIKAAVDALFEEWGIERPNPQRLKDKKSDRRWMSELTEEQRTIIREMVRSMREDGATREEIREAVRAQLEEWGIGENDGGEGAQMIRERKNIQASNAPNPFNPTTTITYSLTEEGPVSVKIYNTQGRLIRTLVDGQAAAGSHSVVWDGLNNAGEQVSSGMYFYKITTAHETITERMMLMK